MFSFSNEQKVFNIGGVKIGGQPGENPSVVVPSIFQKGDRLFSGHKRSEGFNENRAKELLKMLESLSEQTGIPAVADIVANTGEEFKIFIDFFTSVTDMPFCIDAWQMKPKIQGAEHCKDRGLLDRMFYNSLTIWEKDLETEIKEIYSIGVKHVLIVAYDPEDQMPTGRVKGTERILNAMEKAGAEFESIIVDTSVMNAPATAFCSVSNKLIKERWGFPCASAPSNGSYMWKEAKKMWGFKGWSGADAALEAISSILYHDMIFSGPMAGSDRVIPAVAMAEAYLATFIYGESGNLPENKEHPLYKCFPDFSSSLLAK